MAASIGPEVLRAEHVEKSFGKIVALRDVNLRLSRGEVLGLLGDNGAGKSTLMKIFTGFYRPSARATLFRGQARSVPLGQPCALARHRGGLSGPGAGQ